MLTSENSRFRDAEAHLASHFYRGRSVGSEETCHQFPGYDFMFDAGKGPISSTHINRVFISHGHNDHVGGVTAHAWRRGGHALPKATYYAEDVDGVVQFFKAQGRLAGLRGSDWIPTVLPLRPGDDIRLSATDQLLTWRSFHRVPTLGFTLFRERKRLLPAFQGADKDTIIQAKKTGQPVEEVVSLPEITYCGDSTIDVMGLDLVRRSRLLIIECSFLGLKEGDGVMPNEARKTGHVHIEDLVAASREGLFDTNEVVLLTHFSARYTAERVKQALKGRLPPGKFKALLGEIVDV